MTFEPALKQLAFVLPNSFRNAELIFQKRFGQESYIHLNIPQSPRPRQTVSTQQLSSGLWHVILEWWEGNNHYWTEQDIMVS